MPPQHTTTSGRSLSVVIPAYNEEKRLPRTVDAIHGFLLERKYDGEILVIDDGSADRTAEAIARLQRTLPLLRSIRHPRNMGKGHAVKAGMLAATKETVLFCDADQSTPIGDIDRLWPWYDRGFDVVIGSRRLADSEIVVQQRWHRKVIGRMFNQVIGLFGVRGFHDTQCGFKLFRTHAAKAIFSKLRTSGFAFDVEVLLHARKLGLRIAEVPVHWCDDPGSRVRPGRDSMLMLLEVLRLRNVL